MKKICFIFFCFVILFILSLIFFTKDNKIYESIPFLEYHLKFETKEPLNLYDSSKTFLYKGWRYYSEKVEAIRKNSVVKFFIYKNQKKQLIIELEKNKKLKNELDIDLFLNKKYLQNISLKDKIKVKIILPKKYLIRGDNFLRFSANNYKPDINKNTLYFPDRLFCLNIFKFVDKPYLKKQTNNNLKLFQPSNSFFRVAVDTEKTIGILYKVTPVKSISDCKLIVQEKHPDNSNKIIDLIKFKNKKVKQKTIKFNKKRKKIILEFDYNCKKKNSFLKWEKISFINKKRKNKKTPGNHLLFKTKPNIFLIIIDAARYDIVEKHNKYSSVIPNIKSFLKKSYAFKNFYANTPVTPSSISTMLTGLLPETHGDRKTFTQMPENIKSIPFYLKKAGYKTYILISNVFLLKHYHYRDFDITKIIRPVKNKYRLDTSFVNIKKVQKTIQELDTSKSNFLYFHILPPHAPYKIPPNIKKLLPDSLKAKASNSSFNPPKYKNQKKGARFKFIKESFLSYLQNYFYADYIIGKILEKIKDKNIFDSSLIIITSDHGEAFNEHNYFFHGKTVYQEMIKVPFLLKLPYQNKKRTIQTQHSLVDLLPTLARFLNISPDKNWQGNSIFSDLNNKFSYSRAIKEEINNMLILYPYKYMFFNGREEFYNLEKDILETNNLIYKNQFKALLMKQKLFKILYNNLNLRKKLNIKIKENITTNKEFIKELETLGYL